MMRSELEKRTVVQCFPALRNRCFRDSSDMNAADMNAAACTAAFRSLSVCSIAELGGPVAACSLNRAPSSRLPAQAEPPPNCSCTRRKLQVENAGNESRKHQSRDESLT